MDIEQRACATDTGLPAEQWKELRDYLILALDALGERHNPQGSARDDEAIATLIGCIEEYRQEVELSARHYEYFAATSAGMLAIFDAVDAIGETRAIAGGEQ